MYYRRSVEYSNDGKTFGVYQSVNDTVKLHFATWIVGTYAARYERNRSVLLRRGRNSIALNNIFRAAGSKFAGNAGKCKSNGVE